LIGSEVFGSTVGRRLNHLRSAVSVDVSVDVNVNGDGDVNEEVVD
jgi:hypothetical protein